MDFQGLKVSDFAYFERLTVSIKVLGREFLLAPGMTSNRELIKTKYI
jgi:hypothetical protein